MNLGRDVFLALAAVIWSDGKVTAEEARALIGAARACGVTGEDLDAVEDATRDPGALASVTDLTLAHDERLFVYGAARWLADVDGTTTGDETALLATLGELLGLTDAERAGAGARFASSAPGDVRALAERLRQRG